VELLLRQTGSPKASFLVKTGTTVRTSVGGVLLVLVALLAYSPALDGGFIWDDNAHVTPTALRDARGLARIWTDPSVTQQYYPLTHSTFWLQSHLWGERPVGYHVVNVLLHALSALLVWILLRRLHVRGALLAAAIFLLHPVHVESVAWVSELKNSLSGVLYLCAALAWLKFDTPGAERSGPRQAGWWVVSFVLFLCALLAKTVTATLPAALLVVMWWKRGKLSLKRDVAPLIPFFTLGLAMGLTTAWIEQHVIGAQGPDYAFSLIERVLIAGRVFWFYIWKLFWPAKLIFIYPRWTIEPTAGWQYLFPIAALAVVAAAWALRHRIGRGPVAGLLFYGGTLFPVLGFFNVYPFKFSFVADHFQYLASLGILTMVAWAIASGFDRAGAWAKPLTFAACTLLLVVLGGMSFRQARHYKDAETLWLDTTARNPTSFMAFNNLGYEYNRRGRLDEAEKAYQKAIDLKPDFAQGYFNLASLYGKSGRAQRAVETYRKAIELRPGYSEAYYNLGIELGGLGRNAEAIRAFEASIEARPDFAEAHYNLGVALARTGRLEQAARAMSSALVIRPDYPQAQLKLGAVYRELGRRDDALALARAVLDSHPDYPEAHYEMGNVLADAGDHGRAGEAYSAAGKLLGQRRRYAEAAEAFQRSLAQRPDDAETYFWMGVAYARSGRPADAVAAWRSAARLDPEGEQGRAALEAIARLGASATR
jgi:tetratricopeptide (TPR) repeat protein